MSLFENMPASGKARLKLLSHPGPVKEKSNICIRAQNCTWAHSTDFVECQL